MKPIISVEGLGKSYSIRHKERTAYKSLREEIFKIPQRLLRREESREDFWALRDVSFDVMPGDRVGIIGRNGAGKSTLLKLLSRITEPTTGSITLRGRVASLLEVGTGFHPELTGRENIFLNGAILGMSRSEVRGKFDEIVGFAEVEKFLDTPVKRYSSGMYVRLAFAVAAHLEPEILIVDEVLAVGDAEFQSKCLGKMEEVGESGRTVLFVSHNMAAVQQLCGTGMLLKGGAVAAGGDVAVVVEEYQRFNDSLADVAEVDAIDLAKRRPYGCQVEMIKGIRIFDCSSRLKSSFAMLDGVVIEVKLSEMCSYDGVDFGISIHDLHGVRIASYNTWMMGVAAKSNPRKLVLYIPEIVLSPGGYIVNVCAARKAAGEYIDRVEPGIRLNVIEGNVFSTGYPYTRGEGVVFQKASLEYLES